MRFPKPIPAKGKLDLYSLDPDLAAKANAAMATAEVVRQDSAANARIEAMTVPDDEEARRLELLETYIETNDSKSALRLAELGMSRNAVADAILDVARAKQAGGDLEPGMADANRAIDRAPENARACAVRSILYQALSDNDRARAIEIDPIYAEILGESEEGGGDEDPA